MTAVEAKKELPEKDIPKEVLAEGGNIEPTTISSGDNSYESEPNGPGPESQFISSTKLHKTINEVWGMNHISPDIYKYVTQYIDPQSSKKNQFGFIIKTSGKNTIQWCPPTKDSPEGFTVFKKLNEESARAIVTMGRVKGWDTFEVSGTLHNKEQVWLAVQRQNLEEKLDFDKKASGRSPSTFNKDGSPKTHPSITINYMPLPDSKVMLQWQQELAAMGIDPQDLAPQASAPKDNKPSISAGDSDGPSISNESATTTEPKNKSGAGYDLPIGAASLKAQQQKQTMARKKPSNPRM